ncbi:MAG: 30S ribosomal protein S3 [Clostridiales Family XIII bacterium]|jgi:small subunit ribosomal protein S3|nr:30S ribosomal protein S3 [Clostridiales Family XIII bacterium]
MGQKVSPHGLRVGIIKDWDSKWYADKTHFADFLVEDNKIREYVKRKLYAAGISRILIERTAEIKVIVLTDKPGIVIGRSGEGINELKRPLEKMTKKTVAIDIIEIRRAELDAQLTAENIAQALEKRISFRRAMKQAITRTMKSGAKGMKVLVSGRLGGAEIARNEKYSEGNVPLHTLRADINYGFAEADTTYGKVGVKVWINLGEILEKGLKSAVPEDKRGDRQDRGDRRPRNDRPKNDRPRNDRPRRDNKNPRDGRPEIPRAVNPRVKKAPPRPVPVPLTIKPDGPEATTAETPRTEPSAE